MRATRAIIFGELTAEPRAENVYISSGMAITCVPVGSPLPTEVTLVNYNRLKVHSHRMRHRNASGVDAAPWRDTVRRRTAPHSVRMNLHRAFTHMLRWVGCDVMDCADNSMYFNGTSAAHPSVCVCKCTNSLAYITLQQCTLAQ